MFEGGGLRRLGPAIADQGVWSLGGFVLSALTARFLGPESFGLYSVSLAVLVGLGGTVNSLVLDPAAVIGPRDYFGSIRSYGGMVLAGSVAIGTVALLIGAIQLAWSSQLRAAMFAALAIAPILFLAWSCRRLPYLTRNAGLSLVGSVAYTLVATCAVIILHLSDRLSPPSAFLALAAGAVAQVACVLPRWKPTFSGLALQWRPAGRAHWQFGKWFLASEAFSWITNLGLAMLAAALVGLDAAGGYRAAQVLLGPYGVLVIGYGLALLPQMTRLVADSKTEEFVRSARGAGLQLSSAACLLAIVLTIWGEQVMGIVFGPQFAEFGWLVAGLAWSMVLHGWVAGYSLGLQAASAPKFVFLGHATGAVTAVAVGLILGASLGLAGFVLAFILATAARLVVITTSFRRVSRSLQNPTAS